MAFFDKLSEKLSSGATAVSNSTKRVSDIAKLNSKINRNISEINNHYTEIGRIVKLELMDGINNEDVKRLAAEIDTLLAEVNESREKINELKGVKLCSGCGAQISRDVAFCPNCGAKQPVEESPKAEQCVAPVIANEVGESSVEQEAFIPEVQAEVVSDIDKISDEKAVSETADKELQTVSEPTEEKGYIFCTQCGSKEDVDTKFCSQCGNKMD